jgi:hypothetical protein
MRLHTCVAWVVGAAILASSTVTMAQTVTFSEKSDAVLSKFFDAARSVPDPSRPNRLIIGFNTGFDPRTWKFNAFTASTAAFYSPVVADTISFDVEAPAGSYIARITYSQRGTGFVSRGGSAMGTSQWVVDGHPVDIGVFGTNPTVSSTAVLTGPPRTSVSVSITTSLFAFAPPLLGSATISVTGADVVVELQPLSQ